MFREVANKICFLFLVSFNRKERESKNDVYDTIVIVNIAQKSDFLYERTSNSVRVNIVLSSRLLCMSSEHFRNE